MPKPKTIPHPQVAEQWKDRFRGFSMKIGFQLSLSKAMIQFLCATADGVQWDRDLFADCHQPDNWLASEGSLTKRGLIERIPAEEYKPQHLRGCDGPRGEWSCCRLTPAGQAVVGLLKLAGIFVEADAAINKKSRRA